MENVVNLMQFPIIGVPRNKGGKGSSFRSPYLRQGCVRVPHRRFLWQLDCTDRFRDSMLPQDCQSQSPPPIHTHTCTHACTHGLVSSPHAVALST